MNNQVCHSAESPSLISSPTMRNAYKLGVISFTGLLRSAVAYVILAGTRAPLAETRMGLASRLKLPHHRWVLFSSLILPVLTR